MKEQIIDIEKEHQDMIDSLIDKNELSEHSKLILHGFGTRLQQFNSCKKLPNGFKVYKCTDCDSVNVKRNNGEIKVGYCDNCSHPLWN